MKDTIRRGKWSLKAVFAAAILSAAIAALFAQAARAEDEPPAIDKDWNLISIPCDAALDEFKQALGSDEIKVFDWDGEGYVETTSLSRAKGYVLNSNAVLNSSSICENSRDETPIKLNLKKGWNLIGNPFHKAITFNEAFGVSGGKITAIFEYRGNKFVEIEPTDHLKPFRGYWIFASEDVAVDFGTAPACDSLTVSGETPDPLPPGGAFTLKAECVTGAETRDVTAEAEWLIGNAEVLAAGETAGVFSALAEGVSTVSAKFENMTSNEMEITVSDPPAQLLLTAAKTKVDVGGAARLYVSLIRVSGAIEDVTDKVEWNVTDAAVGSVIGTFFTGAGAGTAGVSAALDGLDSNEVSIEVVAEKLIALELKYDKGAIQIHEHSRLTVNAVYQKVDSQRKVDVTSKVAWTLSDASIGFIEGVTFTPTAIGIVSLEASMDGVVSNTVTIVVSGKELKWLYLIPYGAIQRLAAPEGLDYSYSQHTLRIGTEGQYYVRAIYNNDDYGYIDASKVTWELTRPELVDLVEDTGEMKGLTEGTTRVRVYMDGVYSEPVWLHVHGEETERFLAIEYSNRPTIVKKGKTLKYDAILYTRFETQWRTTFDPKLVTADSAWSSTDEAVGTISGGQFSALSAGRAEVSASYDGLTTESVAIDVWEEAEMTYCDAENPNEQTWNDGTSLAVLGTDCDAYGACEPVTIQFTTGIHESSGLRHLDSCLDLYVYNESYELVKTFRDVGCTPEQVSLGRALTGFRKQYEYTAQWDLKDDTGACAPAGKYYAVARFYLTYCPIIRVEFDTQGCSSCE